MEIKEAYVSYELAKLLKEKEFDVATEYVYLGDNKGKVAKSFTSHFVKKRSDILPCPTHQLACAWLREVHSIDIVIDASVGMLGVKVYVPFISTYKQLEDDPSKVRQIKRGIYYKDDNGVIPALQHFDSYEEAVETALKHVLENLI